MTHDNAADKCKCGHERSNHKAYRFGCLGTWCFHFLPCRCQEFCAEVKDKPNESTD